jgi:hypothetical protein
VRGFGGGRGRGRFQSGKRKRKKERGIDPEISHGTVTGVDDEDDKWII